ncbi:MAG TPA: 3-oxoacyl-ACP reductase [Sandaracinaceae bacterium LLY-WYZ-13_1]|nr:3-oxoacyl-ACP reductase [Sandaracinaceae bacterium LLY-WYZ-13_1]
MSDFLLELGKNPNARKMIKQLGLPVPMPQDLARAGGPWEERPLAEQQAVVGVGPNAALQGYVAETLARAGADPWLVGEGHDGALWKAPGEAYGRPAKPLASPVPDRFLANALVFDGSGLESPADLKRVYEFFHPLVGRLARCGRAVVLARPHRAAESPAAAATQRALEGFVRSLAKEIGRRGATAHVVYVDEGAEGRVPALLRYLLSERSAFVSGQPFHVTMEAAKGGGTDEEVPYTRPLEKKVALVTGAARGIGAATARLLAAEGAHVVCLDRPQDDGPLSQVAREIDGAVLLQDVSAPDAPERIANELREKHGGVDVVVHNAGVTRDKTLAKMSEERWGQTIDINLAAVIRIDEALTDGRVLHDGGRIVCLSSVAGIAGNMGQTNYAASKAGIIGYVEALAPTLAGRGITVNAVAPGFIETRLTNAIPVMIREVGRRLSNLGQGGLPRDIGDLVVFLASPGSQGLTGRIVRACGGAFIGA